MGINYLLDTNIIIYYLNGSEEYENYLDIEFLKKNRVYISSITKIELLSFADLTEDEESIIKNLINEFEIIPLIIIIVLVLIYVYFDNSIDSDYKSASPNSLKVKDQENTLE